MKTPNSKKTVSKTDLFNKYYFGDFENENLRQQFKLLVEKKTNTEVPPKLRVLIDTYREFLEKISTECEKKKAEKSISPSNKVCHNYDNDDYEMPSNGFFFPNSSFSSLVNDMLQLLSSITNKKTQFIAKTLAKHEKSRVDRWRNNMNTFYRDFDRMKNVYFGRCKKRKRGNRGGRRTRKKKVKADKIVTAQTGKPVQEEQIGDKDNPVESDDDSSMSSYKYNHL